MAGPTQSQPSVYRQGVVVLVGFPLGCQCWGGGVWSGSLRGVGVQVGVGLACETETYFKFTRFKDNCLCLIHTFMSV